MLLINFTQGASEQPIQRALLCSLLAALVDRTDFRERSPQNRHWSAGGAQAELTDPASKFDSRSYNEGLDREIPSPAHTNSCSAARPIIKP